MSELKRDLFGNLAAKSSASADSEARTDSNETEQPAENEFNNQVEPDQESQSEQGASGRGKDAGSRRRLRPSLRNRKTKRKQRRRISLAFLPTMLTLGNAVCGLAAISVAVSENFEKNLFVAGGLIFIGMLFDALDGSAARMTGQESRFGAELDSLCDVITFGTAPAVIVWRISDVFPQKLSWAIGVLFTLCVLIRLARFNVETADDDPHEGFDGLPSPAAAGTIAAFAIAMPYLASVAIEPTYPLFVQTSALHAANASHYVIPLLAVVLAYLMTSRFQYPHVFQQLTSGRWTTHQFGQALFAIVGGFLLHWIALPIAFCYYAFGPPVRAITRRNQHVTENDDQLPKDQLEKRAEKP